MNTRAITPIVLTTTDEQERKLLLTRGALNRIRVRLKVNNLAEILAKVSTDEGGAMGIFLYECLLNKDGLTEDQFLEIMPFSIEQDQRTIAQILGVSLPEKDESRPTGPPQTIQ